MGRRLVLLPLLGLLALGYAAKCPKQRTSPGREILCYTTTNDIEALKDSICRCTTLVHQGHDLQDLSTSGIEDFQKSLKEMNPVLQFVLSISDTQGSLKTSARVRQEAAARIVRVLNEVDGVELNVTAGTKERLVHFIQGLKTEMVRKSKEKRILLVLPTKTEELAKHFDIKGLSKYVDLFTIPTHYLVDDDEAFRTFHPSRLMGLFDMLNADSLVDLVTGLGAGKRKILVSLPASAYKFTLEKNEDNAPRAPTKEKQPVRISRAEMCDSLDEGEWIVERDEDLTAPYTFMDNNWIAFEDRISAGIKGRYVLLRDLAGLGIHNVEDDAKTKCGDSLTEEVYHSFTDNKRKTREAVLSSLQEDLQQTHNTYPDHVKSSGYRIVRVVDTDGHIHAARENTKTEFSCPRQGYFVHPKSCNRFYRCVKFNQGVDDYSVFEFDCPAGLAFDEHTEVCVWPGSISACSGSSEIAPSKGPKFSCPDHAGYYRDPQNCRFFYACYDLGEHELTAYEFRCPYGLVFDEEKLICEWPYLVPSCGGTYERHDYDHGGHDGGHGGYDEHGGSEHGGHGGYDEHGGSEHGGHGGYDEHGGAEHGGHGGYDEHGGSEHGGHGGYDEHGGAEHGGHGGYDEHGGSEHGGHGGYDQHGGSEHGGHGGYDEHGGSEHGGHGGHDQHGGSEHEGHGGYDQHGGHGGFDQHGGSEHGGNGGYDEHGGSEHGGHGGHDQHGGHGGFDQHGGSEHGGNGGYDQHGGSEHGGHGGHDQHGGSEHEGHGGYDQHGGSSHGGHGGHDQHGGHGGFDQHGGSEHGGNGGYDQHGGSEHGGHGGHDQHGGSEHEGHGGYDQHGGSSHGGHDEHGGSEHGGHGGHDQHGGSEHGGHGGYDQHGGSEHGGHGGYDQHGGSEHGGDRGYDQHGGSEHGGHGGYDQHGGSEHGGHGGDGGYDAGHGGSSDGGHGGDGGYDAGHGGSSDEGHGGGYDGSSQGGHQGGHGQDSGYDDGHGISSGGGHLGGHDGSSQGGHGSAHGGSSEGEYSGGHGVTTHSGHGGYTQSGHEGSTHSVIIDSTHSHGESTEGRYTESYHGQHGTTQSGIKGGYTISSQDGYTKYPVTSRPEYTPAVVTGGGHGYTSIDTGVHTGITSGYEVHTPTIQYGGHTGAGVTHAIDHTVSYDGDEEHAGVAIHHGNFGPTGSGEYTSGTSHTGSSGSSSEAASGSYSIQKSHRGQGGSSGTATGSYGGQNAHGAGGGFTILGGSTQHGNFGSGGYSGGHTSIIQHGGHSGITTQGNNKGQGLGNFATSGKNGPNNYPGNFGPTGSGGYGGSTYSHGNAGGGQSSYGGYAGSTTYHGNYGSTGVISSGHTTQGIIGTDVLTSGTVYTHGDSSGSVIGGTNYQGGIVTGKTQPGYVQTHAGAPGYVVNNGVKTVYPSSGSQGTFDRGIPHEGVVISGAPEPGVVLTGQLTPGTYLKGQTTPGIIHGGRFTPGVTVGGTSGGSHYDGGSRPTVYTGGPGVSIYNGGIGTSIHKGGADSSIYRGSGGQSSITSGGKSPNYQKNPFLTVTGDMGYKTNEYHDNGGRGTIRYNNGEIIHKYTEDDVKDHRNQYGTLPTFDVGSYKATSENQNYQKSDADGVYTQGGFTKTGPTKTGITTAQVGGSGTYVAGSPRPRPFASSDNIGPNAFSASKISSNQAYATSTNAPNVGYSSSKVNYSGGSVDASQTNVGYNRGSSSGYSYTKPKVQLNTFGVTGSTKSSLLSEGHDTNIFSTSARPFVDVHIYNNPSVVTSAPITTAPAAANNYSYGKTPNVRYQETLYNAANLGSSSGAASTGTFSRPTVTDQRKFPAVSSTVSPIAFTTGPLENFRTTVYQAARIPVAVSTAHPVIDTGYKTVVSSTAYPINVNTDSFGYSKSTGYRTDYAANKGSLDVHVSLQPDETPQDKYDNGIPVAPVEIPSSGYSRRPSISQPVGGYERPTIQQQVNYGSTGSSDDYSRVSYAQSQGNFGQKISHGSVTPPANYATPTVVVPQQVYNVPSSTLAPAIGVTYRQPFKVVAVNYDQSTARPISQTQYKDRTSGEGYVYSKPSVKFGSSTASSISYDNSNARDNYNFNSKTTKGGSPTNLDISRTEVEKLVTNYDRGSIRFTPSGYETYSGNAANGFEGTSSANGFSNQQSYSSTSGSSEADYGASKTNFFDKSKSGGYNRISSTTPRYEANSETRGYGNRVESASSGYESSNGNIGVSIKNGAVPPTTYLPGRKISSSTRRPSGYVVTTPTVTTYSGSYSRGSSTPAVTTYSGSYSRGSSTPSYEVTTSSSIGIAKNKSRGKVIVKFSDLHPLLLGKLGAECTCKADPFASFRGTKPLPIDSNKGRVDLRNYDESDVYVDLESSKENGDYNAEEDSTDLGAYHPENYEDDDEYETPVAAVFDGVTPKGIAAKSRRPSSAYLPVSSTQRPPSSTYRSLSSTKRPSSSTYLPPSSTYLPVGFAGAAPSRGGVKTSLYSNGDASVSASFTNARGGGFRAGKSLGSSEPSNANALSGKGAAFDRYGPGGLRGVDETLQGNSDCVRSGLFRHPNFCNKFYACHWDEWKKKFTLHVFNCPVHLTFDSGASACNWPSKGPACQDDNLLV